MHGYFVLYKRTLKSGKKIYYYQAYKPDGTLTSGKTSGCKKICCCSLLRNSSYARQIK